MEQTDIQTPDGDGYGDPNNKVQQCSKPMGYAASQTDCDDSNNLVNPDTSWYRDADGFGNPNDVLHQCLQPTGYVLTNTDCDDQNAASTPLNCITSAENPYPSLTISPNPGNGIYYVRNGNQIDFKIISSVGKAVKFNLIREGELFILDIAHEPNGLYIVLMSAQGINFSSKILKH